MPEPQSTIITALLEHLITTGPESMSQVLTALFDLAMRLYRVRSQMECLFAPMHQRDLRQVLVRESSQKPVATVKG